MVERETKLNVFLYEENSLEPESWQVIERPGYQGKRKEQDIERWNETYGGDNWRLAWQTRSGRTMSFEEVFYRVYLEGYYQYFEQRPKEALWIAQNFSFAYDKDLITEEQSYDPMALYNVPGKPNQFHHVALNLALFQLGYRFRGEEPLKVREGKPGTPESEWPAGWRWSPGRIPLSREFKNEIMAETSQTTEGIWWQSGTVEDFYQQNKVLQVKRVVET